MQRENRVTVLPSGCTSTSSKASNCSAVHPPQVPRVPRNAVPAALGTGAAKDQGSAQGLDAPQNPRIVQGLGDHVTAHAGQEMSKQEPPS